MSLHLIFRSGSLLVNMMMGNWILNKSSRNIFLFSSSRLKSSFAQFYQELIWRKKSQTTLPWKQKEFCSGGASEYFSWQSLCSSLSRHGNLPRNSFQKGKHPNEALFSRTLCRFLVFFFCHKIFYSTPRLPFKPNLNQYSALMFHRKSFIWSATCLRNICVLARLIFWPRSAHHWQLHSL